MGRILDSIYEIEHIPGFAFGVCHVSENHKFHVSWGKNKVTPKII